MSVQIDEAPAVLEPSTAAAEQDTAGDFELDITFLEVGSTVKDLIYMTNDGCGSTCQSACPATCG